MHDGNGEFGIGSRVELRSCTRCSAGTVRAFNRNRLEVVFDDMPGTRWLLRAETLQLARIAHRHGGEAR
jgi:hypothetical protein